MKNHHWIISQEWHDVLFMHYEVEERALSPHCPFPLDLYQGKAIVSIVPFRMRKIRFPFLPALPSFSDLWELNLRTYVNIDGKKGVYFFTLDTDSLLGEFIARKYFHLPYNFAQIDANLVNDIYYLKHKRNLLSLEIEARISSQPSQSDFDHWATERYSLFTHDEDSYYEGKVHHSPWKLQDAQVLLSRDEFSKILPDVHLEKLKSSTYSRQLNVRFSPFRKIGRLHDVSQF